MVMVSVHKKTSCWHKVVVADKYGFSLCETTYKVTKKLHSCMLILQNTKQRLPAAE